MKILLVEDDPNLAEQLAHELSDRRYLVDTASDGNKGWKLAEGIAYDLILLDVGLPQLNGIEFCQKRREKGDRTPILLMTSQDSSTQKVTGLDAGADDYLVKPFDISELLARIRALLRRGHDTLMPTLTWKNLRLEPSQCQVTCNQKPLKVTAKEYELLELFLRHPQQIFSQSILLDRLWSFDDPPSENAVRTHIKSLRQKLKKVGCPTNTIETIYGLGYRLNSSAQAPEETASKPADVTPTFLPIWQRYQQQYGDRLQTIETILANLPSEPHWCDRLKPAIHEAHTLAGSLGSFGLTHLSETARQIEQTLKTAKNPQILATALAPQIQELHQGIFPTSSTPSSPPPLPYILIVEADPSLSQSLKQEASRAHLNPTLVATLSQGKAAISQQSPDLVLLDLSLPKTSPDSIFQWIADIANTQPSVPIVVLADRDTLENRVAVARSGGQGFLHKSISPQQAIASLAPFFKPHCSDSPKLLIVDDDFPLLQHLQQILTPWGLQSTLLSEPQAFWKTLQQTQPDLVLLDIEMPQITGIELCQVLRNAPQWTALPVLFLSSYRDSKTIQQVFLAGGDDYIQKPIVEPELIARIFNRLDRYFYRKKIPK